MASVARGRAPSRGSPPARRARRACPRRWRRAAGACSRRCSTRCGGPGRRLVRSVAERLTGQAADVSLAALEVEVRDAVLALGRTAGRAGAPAGDGLPRAQLRLPVRRAPGAQGGGAPPAAHLVRADHPGAGGVRGRRLPVRAHHVPLDAEWALLGAAPPRRRCRTRTGARSRRRRPGRGPPGWRPRSRPWWPSSAPGCPTPRPPACWRRPWAPRRTCPRPPWGPTPGGRAGAPGAGGRRAGRPRPPTRAEGAPPPPGAPRRARPRRPTRWSSAWTGRWSAPTRAGRRSSSAPSTTSSAPRAGRRRGRAGAGARRDDLHGHPGPGRGLRAPAAGRRPAPRAGLGAPGGRAGGRGQVDLEAGRPALPRRGADRGLVPRPGAPVGAGPAALRRGHRRRLGVAGDPGRRAVAGRAPADVDVVALAAEEAWAAPAAGGRAPADAGRATGRWPRPWPTSPATPPGCATAPSAPRACRSAAASSRAAATACSTPASNAPAPAGRPTAAERMVRARAVLCSDPAPACPHPSDRLAS